MKDAEFIAGEFFDLEIPKDKIYLLKYFKTNLGVAFLRYYLVFGQIRNFVDHTGMYCHWRIVDGMQQKYRILTEVHESAKKNLTEEGLELLQKIEQGKFMLTKYKKS